MFIHENNYEPFPELQTVKYNGMRFYETPEGLKFPSITTVIDKQRGKSEGLQKWRDRIGEEAAKLITRKAAARGTAFHHICEDYINNQDIEDHKGKNFLSWCMFGEMKSLIADSVGKVLMQEQPMYSNEYKVAGRCDLIAEYNGDLAVIDFKTTTSEKKEEWITDYFVQATAYAKMCEEHTKLPVNKVVIMMVSENATVQIWEKAAKDFVPRLEEIIESFYDTVVADIHK